MKPLERSIEKKVVAGLVADGCVVLKIGYDGYPDRLVLTGDGEHFWIEFKRPGGKLRKQQKLRIRALEKLGDKIEVIGGEE
jgi:hypothetical protein